MKRAILTSIFLSSLILAVPASALRSAVYFEGGADNFVFYPGSEWSDADIFGSLKNAMPGDTITQEIKVRNTAPEYDSVKIYLRAEPHGSSNPLSDSVAEMETIASMQDFLAQLSMRVWNADDLIYNASPDQLDGLANNVFLGTFLNGASTTLRIELTVPITLGSEYMHRTGEIDWVFTAECFKDGEVVPSPDEPDEPGGNEPAPTPNNSKTLDNIMHYGWIFILSLTGLVIAITAIRRIVKNEA